MNPTQLAAQVRSRTKTDATTFPDADIIRIGNIMKDDLCERVEDIHEDYFLVFATTNLVALQREYPLSDETMSVKKVEGKLDGSKWIWLKPFDMANRDKATDEATIVADFSNNEGDASYDIIRKSVFIYSGAIANVTAGLEFWYTIWSADISALSGSTDMSVNPSTTSFGIPRQLHRVLLDAIVIEWKQSKDKPIALTERELDWDKNVEIAISKLKGLNLDESTISHLPGASDRGDEGFNY